MSEFFKQSGEYSYVVVAVFSFLLGTMSSIIVKWITRRTERRRLIDLFLADIRRHWAGIDLLKAAAVGTYFARGVYRFKDMEVSLSGEPEYEFEVHNVRLYDTEGVKLALCISQKARTALWDVYALLRDAEAARQLIRQLPAEDKNRESYQTLFVKLVTKLATQMINLERLLQRERSFLSRFVG